MCAINNGLGHERFKMEKTILKIASRQFLHGRPCEVVDIFIFKQKHLFAQYNLL
jgi:hypothetical protein